MSTDRDGPDATTLSPDDAFAVLGHETRTEILQTLGAATGRSPSRNCATASGCATRGFNYHLDKVKGHFVGTTDDGYELRPAGRRVVEAVLPGTVTDAPVMEADRVDEPCPLCGAPTVVAFQKNGSTLLYGV